MWKSLSWPCRKAAGFASRPGGSGTVGSPAGHHRCLQRKDRGWWGVLIWPPSRTTAHAWTLNLFMLPAAMLPPEGLCQEGSLNANTHLLDSEKSPWLQSSVPNHEASNGGSYPIINWTPCVSHRREERENDTAEHLLRAKRKWGKWYLWSSSRSQWKREKGDETSLSALFVPGTDLGPLSSEYY